MRPCFEVCKFLSPQELLLVEAVSSKWRESARSDEAWAPHVLVPLRGHSGSLRDLCREQLTRPHFIAHIDFQGVQVYYPRRKQFQRLSLAEFVPGMMSAWLSIPGQIFYCGGLEDMQQDPSCALLSLQSGEVRKLPNMRIAHLLPGLVYFHGKVFVFGGTNSELHPDQDGMKECEKFTQATEQWSPLPDMSQMRAIFNPARLKSVVYIAGGLGSDCSVEIFSLTSETFQTSAMLQVSFSNCDSTAVAFGNSLVIISYPKISQYDEQTGALLREVAFEAKDSYSQAGVVECDGIAYFAASGDFWTVTSSLATAKLELGP